MNNSIINIKEQKTIAEILKAISLAAFHHRHQKRKGAAGIPYINHPIEVVNLLAQRHKSPSCRLLVAAALHDTIEDTSVKTEDLLQEFGKKTLSLILEVTDNMALPSFQRKRLQIKTIKSLSEDAIAIKIADKTCNINDILTTRINWSKKRKINYVIWSRQVIDQVRDIHPGLIQEFDKAVSQASISLKYNFET